MDAPLDCTDMLLASGVLNLREGIRLNVYSLFGHTDLRISPVSVKNIVPNNIRDEYPSTCYM